MKHKHKGFSLLELMLVLVFIVAASAIAYKMFKPSQTQAAVRQEQQNVGKLVDGIMGAYSTANNFSTLSTATAAGVLNLPFSANGLNSAMKTDVTVRPATSTTSNDSFDLVYASLSPEKCIALIPALSSRSSAIFIGQRTQNLQNNRGEITDESLVAAQCSESSSTSVTFRFRADKNTFAATTMDSCLCAPETETQTVACPANSAGSITQRRTGTCTGGTPACPSLQWSSWVTASNTCGANAAPVTPTTPVAPVAPQTCVPSVETQTVACPSGQVGGVLQQRSRTCPANTWGAWSNVSSSCQPDPNRAACTPRTQRQTAACPAGQGGQIVQERASTCDANGNELWSNDWKNISSTCTASCVANGTCCTVSRQTSTDLQYCGVGNYGSIQRDLYRTSTCDTATSTPAWPSTWSERSRTGTCTACPAPTQDQETQNVAASAACPAGQTGSHTWTSVQMRTRTRSYDCSSDRTLNLPAPTIGAWSGWSEVARSGETNTCAAPSNSCYVMTDWQTGTSDTRDAYWSISYSVKGVPFSCSISLRDGRDPSVCTQQALSLDEWRKQAWDGETYTTSGSEGGWGGGGGEFWSWDYNLYERRSGAACGSTNTGDTFPTATPSGVWNGAWAEAGSMYFGWAIPCSTATMGNAYASGNCIRNPNVSETFGGATWAPPYYGPINFNKSGTPTSEVQACLNKMATTFYGNSMIAMRNVNISWPSECSCQKLGGASVVLYQALPVGWDSDGLQTTIYEYKCQ
jgi:type II secretory pathway pseudopilin PulG